MRTVCLVVCLLLLGGGQCFSEGFTEEFGSNPIPRGWRWFGEASLFKWAQESQALEVTWDSTLPNSYFYRSLNNILAKNDDFALRFDLRLDSIQAGANPAKPSTF